ncbi:MAG: polysaccharide biosynthesis protein, partial [Sulfitobacter sp.]
MLQFVKALTKAQKRNIFLALDSALIPITLLFVFFVQPLTDGIGQTTALVLPVLPYLMAAGIGLSLSLGICSMQLNTNEIGGIRQLAMFATGLALSSYLLCEAAGPILPLGVHVVFGISFFVAAVISRALLLKLVQAIYRTGTRRCRVLIYGAGATGTQLVSALRAHDRIEPVAFVDDNAALQGLRISRLPVYGPKDIAAIVATKKIDRVLLAMPSVSKPKQIQIARRLQQLDLEVQMLPSFAQLIGQEALVEKLQPVPAQQFLNRVEIHQNLLPDENCYLGRSVLVTGAGGTIASELCRQLLGCQPTKIILFELNELALYQIDKELRQCAIGADVQIVPVLGSVTDA